MDLAVTKSIDNLAPAPLDVVTYTVTVSNAGPEAATAAAVADVLPSGVWYLGHSNGAYSAGSGAWSIGELGAGRQCLVRLLHSGGGSQRGRGRAPKPCRGADDSGSVYLYDTNGALLVTITNPVPGDGDRFGYSVAAVGSNKVVVGAYRDDVGGPFDDGSAYVFDLPAGGAWINPDMTPSALNALMRLG